MPVHENTQIIQDEELAIAFEMDKINRDLRDGSKGLEMARDRFGDGMALANTCEKRVVANMNQTGEAIKPDGFQLQFSVMLDTKVGARV